ncbi:MULTISPECIES: hypothetical protein [Rhodococcus]|uniref:Hypothetical membrane protein n=2 Tax=Rhodococcus TaxID=1827 RepID=C0ZPN3_RHOE4|nr:MULTISPECIES: hypothetical protein [Rhodococcus]MCW0190813.1 hypothetical protein [Rhodococcus sp. (in: high G+C Gram-positive bacteria)]AKD95932.1 hypothetical protein XU06_03395 [Rhodococcus erythropolis]ALU73128.1 hypothetical protein H351_29315 [Rhodococcus erythropolis R138]ATI35065.1 hypothetical protein CPI83_25580 [Rhodococcus sp. H-CA8f]MBF7735420.1 hypothetical protein [Rhodococcus erythropolis]
MNRPGDLLLSPWALVSVAVILVNDHVLKGAFGNTMTGKLSDVAGVFLFPLLLLSVLEVLRRKLAGRAAIAWSIAVTGIGFAAVKTVSPIGDAYEWVIGFFRWTAGGFRGELLPIVVFRDPSDLWVLPILFASYLVVTHNRTRAPQGAPEHEVISPVPHPT